MNRRGFLQAILATGAAPAVFSSGIASGILMPVRKLVTQPHTILYRLNGELYEKDLGGVTVLNEHWLGDAIRSGETVYWQDITMTIEEYMQRGRGTYRDYRRAMMAKKPFAAA